MLRTATLLIVSLRARENLPLAISRGLQSDYVAIYDVS